MKYAHDIMSVDKVASSVLHDIGNDELVCPTGLNILFYNSRCIFCLKV